MICCIFDKFQGFRTHHSFTPKEKKIVNENYIQRFPCSSHVVPVLLPSSVSQIFSLVLDPEIYACVYEGEWLIGPIIEVSDEKDNVGISFMKQKKVEFCMASERI